MRYEFKADVYESKVDKSMEYPSDIDRSLTRRSMVQASRRGCLDEEEISIIFLPAPSSIVGVEKYIGTRVLKSGQRISDNIVDPRNVDHTERNMVS